MKNIIDIYFFKLKEVYGKELWDFWTFSNATRYSTYQFGPIFYKTFYKQSRISSAKLVNFWKMLSKWLVCSTPTWWRRLFSQSYYALLGPRSTCASAAQRPVWPWLTGWMYVMYMWVSLRHMGLCSVLKCGESPICNPLPRARTHLYLKWQIQILRSFQGNA